MINKNLARLICSLVFLAPVASFAVGTTDFLGLLNAGSPRLEIKADGYVTEGSPHKFNASCQNGDAYLFLNGVQRTGTASLTTNVTESIIDVSFDMGTTFTHVTNSGCPLNRIPAKDKGNCLVTFTTDGLTVTNAERITITGKTFLSKVPVVAYLCLETND